MNHEWMKLKQLALEERAPAPVPVLTCHLGFTELRVKKPRFCCWPIT